MGYRQSKELGSCRTAELRIWSDVPDSILNSSSSRTRSGFSCNTIRARYSVDVPDTTPQPMLGTAAAQEIVRLVRHVVKKLIDAVTTARCSVRCRLATRHSGERCASSPLAHARSKPTEQHSRSLSLVAAGSRPTSDRARCGSLSLSPDRTSRLPHSGNRPGPPRRRRERTSAMIAANRARGDRLHIDRGL